MEAQPQTLTDQPWPLTFDLALADEPSQLQLDHLTLTGLGLSVRGGGSHLKETRGLKADLSASLTAGAPWRDLAAQLVGQKLADFFDGRLELGLNIDWPDLTGPAQGDLKLQAQQLHWPWPELRPLLGSEAHLTAALSGGEGQPYRFNLKEAEAGLVNLQGQALFAPANNEYSSESFRAGRFQIDIQAGLADMASVVPNWQGPLEAHFKADGLLTDLSASLLLSSPALKMPSGELRGLDSALMADLSRTGEGGLQASGSLQAQAEARPGGSIKVDSGWTLAQSDGGYEASLKNMAIDGGGLRLAADLAGRLTTPTDPKTAQLSGELDLAVQDWSFLAAVSGQPLAGKPSRLRASFEQVDSRQNVRLNLNLPELKLRSGSEQPDILVLRDLSGNLETVDIFQKPLLDLNLTTGSGQAGPLRWSLGLATVKGTGEGGDLKIAFRQPQGDQDLLTLQGRYNISAPSLTLNQFNFVWPGSRSGLRLEKPVVLALDGGVEVNGLSASVKPGGRLTAEAAFKNGRTKLKAAIQDLPFSFFQAFTEASLPEGSLKTQINLDGGLGRAVGDFDLTTTVKVPARNRRDSGQSSVSLNLNGRLAGSALQGAGQLSLGTRGRDPGELTYRLPLIISDNGLPQPDMNGPLNASFKWRGSLERIWQVLLMPDRSLCGQGEIDLILSGSLRQIKHDANIYIAGGRYEDLVTGLLLDNISLETQSASDGSIRALLSAKDAHEGRVALEGSLRPGDVARVSPTLAFRGQFTHLQPFQRDDLALQLSGVIGANGPLTAPAITGKLVVEQGEFSLLSLMGGGSVRTLTISREAESRVQAVASGPSCDVDIVIPNQFYVRGRGLDSEWQGNLKLQGALSGLALTGAIKPVRGYFELLSKEFTITSGDIRFLGGPRINPGLHLEMTYSGPQITALVLVEGTVNRPKLTLTSRPPHPQDEVLAQVLFGKSASDLSRFEALQLAQGLRELTGMSRGEFNPITTAREAFGLDVLRIGAARGESSASRASDLSGSRGDIPGATGSGTNGSEDDIGGTTIEAGKYLSNNVYVGLEQGLETGSTGVRVEVELRPNLSLEGRTSTDSSQVGLGWKKDY